MKAAHLAEEQMKIMLDAGYFRVILIHPRVEIYETDDSVVMFVPGKGAIQVATKDNLDSYKKQKE